MHTDRGRQRRTARGSPFDAAVLTLSVLTGVVGLLALVAATAALLVLIAALLALVPASAATSVEAAGVREEARVRVLMHAILEGGCEAALPRE